MPIVSFSLGGSTFGYALGDIFCGSLLYFLLLPVVDKFDNAIGDTLINHSFEPLVSCTSTNFI
jgi:hypothetical protein